MVLLPAPFGPISPRISPAARSKLTLSTATRPPNRRYAASTRSNGVRGLRFGSARERVGFGRQGLLRPRQPAGNERHDPAARMLQEHDEQDREHDDFELARRALGDQREIVLDAVLQEGDDAGTDDGAEQFSRSADHRHHQVIDADIDVERRRAARSDRDERRASRTAPRARRQSSKVMSLARNALDARGSPTSPLPPRSARIARPSRDCSRLRDSSRAAIKTAQIR